MSAASPTVRASGPGREICLIHEKLHDDVLIKVFEVLAKSGDYLGLVHLTQVCRKFRAVIHTHENMFWKDILLSYELGEIRNVLENPKSAFIEKVSRYNELTVSSLRQPNDRLMKFSDCVDQLSTSSSRAMRAQLECITKRRVQEAIRESFFCPRTVRIIEVDPDEMRVEQTLLDLTEVD